MVGQHLLSFFIRWIHVVSMSVLLGGVLLFLTVLYESKQEAPKEWLTGLARRYEWIFWLALGTQIITGIGNIGSFGAGVPSATSPWGAKLFIKLLVVTLFVVFSLVRTLITVRVDVCVPMLQLGRASSFLKGAHGLSAIVLVTIILLAEALAHG